VLKKLINIIAANVYTKKNMIDKKNQLIHQMVSGVHEMVSHTHEMILPFEKKSA